MSNRARNRPPHLETRVGVQHAEPPPTLPELLERSHVAGRASGATASELRRSVERAAGDRAHWCHSMRLGTQCARSSAPRSMIRVSMRIARSTLRAA